MAGMPVEVFIKTHPRTVVSYLTKPLRERLLQPREVVYADMRLFFKSTPDPANHGVFRFVWLDDLKKELEDGAD